MMAAQYITYDNATYGASILLNNFKLKDIHQKLDSNYYIIPVSSQGLMVIPERQTTPEILEHMLSVSRTQLAQNDESLTNDILYFNGSKIICTEKLQL